jgi:cytochrome c biogenesis protein CcmG/thiol:disulfide interchange protein DsbE
MVGRKMPALELQMIQGGESVGLSQGAVATLSRSPSKILFVNFWASWCSTCRDEEADLEAFWQAHKDEGVMMLGLAFNDESEAAKAIVTANKTTYPVALDVDNKSALAYGITGVPETFAIGSDGVIVHHQIGPVDRPLLEAILQKMR